MNVIGVSRIVELCRKLDRLEVTYHDDCNTAVKILTDVSDIQVTAVMYIIVMHWESLSVLELYKQMGFEVGYMD